MKKIVQIISIVVLFSACSLEEWNPATVDFELAYQTKEGYESVFNFCYNGLYYYYGKADGIGPMEMGTDLWANFGTTQQTEWILYDGRLNTTQPSRKVWDGLYATVNFCNLAIYYANTVEGYASEAELNAKLGEVYFLRAWSNWHLVEQYGGIVLRMLPSTITGPDQTPQRSSEEAFYEQIFSDLEYACQYLPLEQHDRGRVARKAAYAMVAKAALQRTRIGEKEKYAKMALDAAEELINNQGKYGVALWKSDANQSGFAKVWAGANNKNNPEFIFLEAIDDQNGYNPESWNRGRTRQYYALDARLANGSGEWGTEEQDFRLSRTNTSWFKPTKYLLTEIFQPVKDPADTRFAETFFYEYYKASNTSLRISQTLINKWQKNPDLLDYEILPTNGPYSIQSRGGQTVGGGNAQPWMSGMINMELNESGPGAGYPKGLCLYTPNWYMTAEEKRNLPFCVIDPADWFDAEGKWVTVETSSHPATPHIRNVFPSLKKFSAPEYLNHADTQHWLGDFPIIRMGEIYLIAAEAALLYNNDRAKALQYVNEIRKRAAVTSRENEMLVTQNEMTLDYILAERARELCGEQVRWYDLKRMGKLTKAYLAATNPDIIAFEEPKHLLRPIPQNFLDAITNPDEFGNNGY